MTRTIVLHKINQMPDSLMDVVSILLDKLLEGYEIGKTAGKEEFTESELGELDNRHDEMLANPSASVSMEEVKSYMRAKHGV